MSGLTVFEDVHPNWEVVASLTSDAAEAALDLMLMATYINNELTADEVEVLTEEWAELPFVGAPEDADELVDRLLDTHSSIRRVSENPDLFDEFIDDAVGRIESEDAQMAVFRLVAIVAAADGLDEREADLCMAFGRRIGLERDTVDDILRSIWASRHEAESDDSTPSPHSPPERGSAPVAERADTPSYNPFSTTTKT
jgi:hypothetical protein